MRLPQHQTVVVTEQILRDLGCCHDAIGAYLCLLPAKISTDPEENYDLAFALATSQRAKDCWHDAAYFAGRATGVVCLSAEEPDADHYLGGTRFGDGAVDWNRDPYVAAQHLAIAADALSRRGK